MYHTINPNEIIRQSTDNTYDNKIVDINDFASGMSSIAIGIKPKSSLKENENDGRISKIVEEAENSDLEDIHIIDIWSQKSKTEFIN